MIWTQPFSVINDTLHNNHTLLEDLLGEKAFFFINLYLDPQKKNMSDAISVLVVISLMCGMLSLGDVV